MKTDKCFWILLGTRPEVIKLAPVFHALKKINANVLVIHTGQHDEMTRGLLAFFEIPIWKNLGLMAKVSSLNGLFAGVISGLEDLIQVGVADPPDGLFVQGDTTSCAAGAVWGFNRRISVHHVEAGLRTYNLKAPWPEEFNRRVVSAATDWHFCPTQRAADHLVQEKFSLDRIRVVGNTVIDALLWADQKMSSDEVAVQGLKEKFSFLEGGQKLILTTVHRRESFGAALEEILSALDEISKDEEFCVVLPVHRNPVVRETVDRVLLQGSKVICLEPLEYHEFVFLMKNSWLILSDSGGVQEEAPSLGKKVLVLRETTERQEPIEDKVCELVGSDKNLIVKRVYDHLKNPSLLVHQPYQGFGDGKAADKIVKLTILS